MKLSDIKYKGPKIDNATKNSTYVLCDFKIGVLFTGSFRQCYIKREYLAQHDDISNYEINVIN